MPLRVTVAGPVGIEVDGIAVDISRLGRSGRLVLAYLVCERHRPVPRDEVAEVLWGEHPPPSWEQMVRGNASRVRAVLASAGVDPTAAVTGGFGTYQVHLPPDAVVDVEEAGAAIDHALAAIDGGNSEEAYAAVVSALAVVANGFLPGRSGIWVEQRQAETLELRLRA